VTSEAEIAASGVARAQPASLRGIYKWYVVFLLFLAYASNMADRQVVGILAEPVRRELHLLDWQMGFLAGPAVAFFYAILGIPCAYVADRVNRVRFLSVCLAVWSGLTILGGVALNFVQLALTRVGVSIAEAGGTPCSSSIIADYFSPEQRPRAMGFFASASSVGVFISFAIGGIVSETFGWRGAFVAAGLPGVVLGLMVFLTVREPQRGAADDLPAEALAQPLFATIRHLWSIGLYRRVVIAGACVASCVLVINSWGPSFIIRKFHVGAGEVGLLLGGGLGLMGGVSIALGGIICAALLKRGIHAPLRFAGLMQLIAMPCLFFAITTDDYRLAILGFSLAYGVQHFYTPMFWVVAQNYAPTNMRAMAAALGILIAALVGQGVTPLVIGVLSDAMRQSLGARSLQSALLMLPVLSILAAFLYFRTAALARAAAPGIPRHDKGATIGEPA
jgi:predicted MFS family arabinose efflux permease